MDYIQSLAIEEKQVRIGIVNKMKSFISNYVLYGSMCFRYIVNSL